MATPTVFIAALSLAVLSAAASAAYTNYTVGGNSGWLFNDATNTSSANYSAWAANNTFNLGDYLVFNTNSNQTVIQTYNLTIYQSCSIDDSDGSDTFQYDGGVTSFGQAMTIPVPLTIEGTNYFFSDADDGVQCQAGMRFQIKVNHGSGLPPSLNQPPPPPYMEPPGPGTPQSPSSVTTAGPSGNGGVAVGRNVPLTVTLIGVVTITLGLIRFV
ncbi:hypothetical protein MLD38_016555 [Melastoma candidum]|uniref:Uncharacterized protein n=1 Tax=Melastoma candidum TaxID=119954 RepID=A0ACB9QM58_9MYRT|nr:hypothetical protein MLD38_016555 [Melastoma candidum]